MLVNKPEISIVGNVPSGATGEPVYTALIDAGPVVEVSVVLQPLAVMVILSNPRGIISNAVTPEVLSSVVVELMFVTTRSNVSV